MQYSRIISVLSFFFAFVFVFTSASPILDTETAVARRQDADIVSILTKLRTDAVASAQAINAQAKEDPSEDKITPLFNTLVSQINDATSAIAALEPVGTQKRQSPLEVATLLAGIITGVTTALAGVLTQLQTIPTIGTLFSGLDAALAQLIKGLEGLLAGVLNLVATL
ncbi:hypothetical protein AURDEDRAFT_51008 [Auricularia subglabra TFB-10046 SS5]|nr:hypothetical protein AURDEDRAFT_51008 [Auricularia subglabra TFB-10046 SS5]